MIQSSSPVWQAASPGDIPGESSEWYSGMLDAYLALGAAGSEAGSNWHRRYFEGVILDGLLFLRVELAKDRGRRTEVSYDQIELKIVTAMVAVAEQRNGALSDSQRSGLRDACIWLGGLLPHDGVLLARARQVCVS